jgi:hypothetical protein
VNIQFSHPEFNFTASLNFDSGISRVDSRANTINTPKPYTLPRYTGKVLAKHNHPRHPIPPPRLVFANMKQAYQP